jgi:hypothetical protein
LHRIMEAALCSANVAPLRRSRSPPSLLPPPSVMCNDDDLNSPQESAGAAAAPTPAEDVYLAAVGDTAPSGVGCQGGGGYYTKALFERHKAYWAVALLSAVLAVSGLPYAALAEFFTGGGTALRLR